MKKILAFSILLLGLSSAHGQTTVTETSNVLNITTMTEQTSSSQSFYIGHQIGASYSSSLPIFSAVTDNTVGSNNIFFSGTTNGTTTFSVNENGLGYFASSIGVGTTSPTALLHLYGGATSSLLNIQNTTASYYSQMSFIGTGRLFNEGVGNASETFYGVPNCWYLFDGTTHAMRMVVTSTGSVLIGQTLTTSGLNTAYMLNVAGSARMNSVVVNTTGADFVFEPTYKLMPLDELAAYLKQNHHLPGIAPASDMQINGMDLGGTETKLLQKVEELTLYLVEKDKQLDEEKRKNQEQEERLKKLEAEVQALMNAKQ